MLLICRYILPGENLSVSLLTLGEGWHNYHHAFPWDYRAGEFGRFVTNPTTSFINFFAKLGWAYDLNTASMDMVKKRVEKTGDGSHAVWGLGDKDLPVKAEQGIITIHKNK